MVGDARRLVAFAVLAFAVGCGQLLGVTDWEVVDAGSAGRDASVGETSGGDASPKDASVAGDSAGIGDTRDGARPKSCVSPKSGPGSVAGVLILSEFCIDSTEAPVASYAVFLNDIHTNPAEGQPPECAWNTTYAPGYNPYAGVFADAAAYPQTTIDWCDALAYCTYWGKHLCGNRSDGGPLDVASEGTLPQDGQWYSACTNGTSQGYPYGNILQTGACNVGAPDEYSSILPVTEPATCVGGVPGLLDMVGNVSEWENACVPGEAGPVSDLCQQRGGPLFFAPSDDNCQAFGGNYSGSRGTKSPSDLSPWTGIRCCWEP
jgi:formylglycine-generating enzyme